MSKIKSLKKCSFCEREVYKLANPSRGLCAACYYREKRNGSLQYKPLRVRKPCRVEGCESPSIAQQLCELHYGRMRTHGVVEDERFDRWGHKSRHPLKDAHHNIVRRGSHNHSPEWANFWTFVRDVGERPPRHKLQKLDDAQPWGKDNFYWKPPKLDIDTSTREGRNAYARAYRAANPELYREQFLRKKYGVSVKWYEAKLSEQNGVCAICHEPETTTRRGTGFPRQLAVDHCHSTNSLRDLLCTNCNNGLGSFKDSPELLRKAIDYLGGFPPS